MCVLPVYWALYRAENAGFTRTYLKISLWNMRLTLNPPIEDTVILLGDSRISSLEGRCLLAGHSLAYFGLAGTTTEFWKDYVTDGLLPKARAAVIWLGVNDLIRNPDTPTESLKDEILDIVLSLSLAAEEIVLVGQVPIRLGWPGDPEINRSLHKLEKFLINAVPENVTYLQLYDQFADNLNSRESTFYSDGLHLSALGDQKVCDLIHDSLKQ